MPRALAASGLACALVLFVVPPGIARDDGDDPKSNNTGKILGKWKLMSFPGMEEAEKVFKELNVTMYFEFEKDGTFAMGFESPNKEVIEAIKKQAGSARFTAKYKLLAGDGVELFEFSKGPLADAFKGQSKARSELTIKPDEKEGDQMTLKDPDGKLGKLVRMKTPAPKPDDKK